MAHKVPHVAIAVLLTAATWLAMAGDARAQGYGAPGWASPEPNFYAMPTGSEGLTAALYPSPRPTPPLVGQTYITYQPLAPQEFMYLHARYYKTYNDTHQVTRTTVIYGHHLSLHPSLMTPEPMLRTPAKACAK